MSDPKEGRSDERKAEIDNVIGEEMDDYSPTLFITAGFFGKVNSKKGSISQLLPKKLLTWDKES